MVNTPPQEYDPIVEIPQLAQEIESWFFKEKPLVFLAFRAAYVSLPSSLFSLIPLPTHILLSIHSVSELPHKLHHYASLLAHLSLKSVTPPVSLASRISSVPTPSSYPPSSPAAPGLPAKPIDSNGLPPKPVSSEEAEQEGGEKKQGEVEEEEKEVVRVNVGKEIVEDLMKAFQAFLDERKWRSVRYCVKTPFSLLPSSLSPHADPVLNMQVILFAQLTSLPLSSPLIASTSLLTLLSSFLSVLDEPGLRSSRGDECVRIIVEALLRLEVDEHEFELGGGESLKEGVRVYGESRRVEKDCFADEETKGQWVDVRPPLFSSLTYSANEVKKKRR